MDEEIINKLDLTDVVKKSLFNIIKTKTQTLNIQLKQGQTYTEGQIVHPGEGQVLAEYLYNFNSGKSPKHISLSCTSDFTFKETMMVKTYVYTKTAREYDLGYASISYNLRYEIITTKNYTIPTDIYVNPTITYTYIEDLTGVVPI